MLHSCHELLGSADAADALLTGQDLIQLLGPMLVVAWPEHDRWLVNVVPEFVGEDITGPTEYLQLPAHLRKKLKLRSGELDTVYRVRSPVLLTRLLLAAIRHSELSIVCLPQDVSDGHIVRLLNLADECAYQIVDERTELRVPWMLDVGCYHVDEKCIQLFTEDEPLHGRLSEITSRVLTRTMIEQQRIPE